MKLSKRDFLKFLGGGSAAVGASAALSGGAVAKLDASTPALREVEPPSREHLLTASDYDVIDTVLYDRIVLHPGNHLPEYFNLFTTPLGGRCPVSNVVKHDGLTNMYSPGTLPAPLQFWVRKLHVVLGPRMTEANLRLIRNYGWNLRIGQKRYDGGAVALDGRTDIEVTPSPNLASIEGGRETRTFPDTRGLYIPVLCYFSVEMRGPGGYVHYATDPRRGYAATYAFVMHGPGEPGGTTYSGLQPVPESEDGGGDLDILFALEGVMARAIQ